MGNGFVFLVQLSSGFIQKMTVDLSGRGIMVIDPKDIALIWEGIWAVLKDAVEHESEQDIFMDIQSGNRFLMTVGSGYAVVSNQARCLYVDYVAGKDIGDWKEAMDREIVSIAKHFGKSKIAAIGRPGWKKIWPKYHDTGKHMFIREIA